MADEKREGPRISLKIVCTDCVHLEAVHSYNAEAEESEWDRYCKAASAPGTKAWVYTPFTETPKWCPFYPKTEDIEAAI